MHDISSLMICSSTSGKPLETAWFFGLWNKQDWPPKATLVEYPKQTWKTLENYGRHCDFSTELSFYTFWFRFWILSWSARTKAVRALPFSWSLKISVTSFPCRAVDTTWALNSIAQQFPGSLIFCLEICWYQRQGSSCCKHFLFVVGVVHLNLVRSLHGFGSIQIFGAGGQQHLRSLQLGDVIEKKTGDLPGPWAKIRKRKPRKHWGQFWGQHLESVTTVSQSSYIVIVWNNLYCLLLQYSKISIYGIILLLFVSIKAKSGWFESFIRQLTQSGCLQSPGICSALNSPCGMHIEWFLGETRFGLFCMAGYAG